MSNMIIADRTLGRTGQIKYDKHVKGAALPSLCYVRNGSYACELGTSIQFRIVGPL